jgi:hypothetical protein
VIVRNKHAFVPQIATLVYTAQLPLQQGVKLVDVLLCPLDARGHELLGKALLEHVDGVFDDGEVNVGDLEDVVGQIAFENALPRWGCQ